MSLSDEVGAAARDLDKAPTGEAVIEQLVTGIVKLQRRLAAAELQIATQQRLMDSHEHRVAMLETALPKGKFNA